MFFGPEHDMIFPKVKVVVKVQLLLENYMNNLKATVCKSSNQTPVLAPVKRMGLRI